MTLQLYNSLTKRKEAFIPLDNNSVRMYVCGPTVYDYPHLGNALAVVIYDVLYRLLVNIYGFDKVTYVRNITDVDDKIIKAALDQNISIATLTEKITSIFHSNIKELNCLEPNFEPKATEHISEMLMIIEKLLANNYAYISEGHVYFSVNKFKEYGNLSGRNLEDLMAGARVEIAENKENAADFVLWKPSMDIDHSFSSPYGQGRPGWHIECSAMSYKYLGESFDIHGGGVDLIFPHHTNEVAQSCCAFEGSKYANFWVHNGFLTVNGEKMSKSLGNFVTINELIEQGISGEVIRYVLLSSHYRKPLDWNKKSLDDAQKALDSFYRVLEQMNVDGGDVTQEFKASLLDDLNTPQSFALLHEYVHMFNKTNIQEQKKQISAQLKACGQLLGFLYQNPKEWFLKADVSHQYIEEQITKRIEAKSLKNWQEADRIREELKSHRVILEDLADGSSKWRRG